MSSLARARRLAQALQALRRIREIELAGTRSALEAAEARTRTLADALCGPLADQRAFHAGLSRRISDSIGAETRLKSEVERALRDVNEAALKQEGSEKVVEAERLREQAEADARALAEILDAIPSRQRPSS